MLGGRQGRIAETVRRMTSIADLAGPCTGLRIGLPALWPPGLCPGHGPIKLVYVEPLLPDVSGPILGTGGVMTLGLAVQAEGAIVMATDGLIVRPVEDSYVRDSTTAVKLYGVGRFGIALAGYHGFAESLLCAIAEAGYVAAASGLYEAAQLTTRVCLAYCRQQFGSLVPPSPPGASLLIAGYEADGVTPGAQVLHSRAAFTPGPFGPCCIGTDNACRYVDVLRQLLLPEDGRPIPLEQAKTFAVLAIQMMSDIDVTVGGTTQLAVVTPDAYVDVTPEVSALTVRSAALRRQIRGLLRP
jgi:20S proteasome alpha/beta subunit